MPDLYWWVVPNGGFGGLGATLSFAPYLPVFRCHYSKQSQENVESVQAVGLPGQGIGARFCRDTVYPG